MAIAASFAAAHVFSKQGSGESRNYLHVSSRVSGHGARLRLVTVAKLAAASTSKLATSIAPPTNLDKEAHKYFDQVTIIVRSGDGGDGAILNMTPPKDKNSSDKNNKNKAGGGSLRRGPDGSILLPVAGQGGDVVICAAENVDSLIPFHKKTRYNARRGSNLDAMAGFLTSFLTDGAPAPTLKINVPPGTVVKQKKGSKLLADLVNVGDKVLVARGGRGGVSLLDTPKSNPKKRGKPRTIDAPMVTDPSDKALTKGLPGEEVVLELTLRVVADIGLVGLPNAGKSSLLAAVSRATPEIASYPFTTLMPNLGRITGSPDELDGGFSAKATVADLPGLIEDAHLGKGLGRMFLRHLKRTRLIVHVVDSSAQDPVEDYRVLRKELRLYNPSYLDRPHLVVLNKVDLLEGLETIEEIKNQIHNLEQDEEMRPSQKAAVVAISALKRQGIQKFLKQVRSMLEDLDARPTTKQYAEVPRYLL